MTQSGKRMNWGVGLIIGFGVFVAGILTMVVISMSREVDLVTEGYYDEELRYQDRIHALQRGADPEYAPSINESHGAIVLQFPRHRAASRHSGTVVLYRPSGRNDDVRVPVRLDAGCQQVIPTDRLARGAWRVQIAWQADGTACYVEKIVMLQ
jgi:nitrogen fixation protein FixH